MRVLITGSRTWKDSQAVFDVLTDLWKEHGAFTLVHGNAASGADFFGRAWVNLAKTRFSPPCEEEAYNCEWYVNGKFDRAAGVKRNQKMVDLGADLVIAFPTICKGDKKNCPPEPHYSHGTAHCMAAAEKAGIPVSNYGPDLDSLAE
jgi:hypothetical protein